MLSVLGTAIYLLVASLCVTAAVVADRNRSGRTRARVLWLAIGILFVLLAVSRLTNFEEDLRTALRFWLLAEGEYEERRTIQRLFLIGLVAVACLVGAARFLRHRRGPNYQGSRATNWAVRGAAAMVGLVALRLISFHPTDALLYELKLNWVIDPGLSALVGTAAWFFIRSPTAQPRSKP